MVTEIVNSTAIILLWLVYSYFEGIREAYYYDAVNRSDRFYPNIHWMFFLQRGIILLIVGLFTWDIILPIGLAMVFPFIHDGFYYMKRNDMEPRIYKKRFRDASTNSTAFLEMNYFIRLFLFLAGIITLAVHYLFLIYL